MNSAIVWSVRRELWENRSIYMAPALVAVVIAFAAIVGTLVATSSHPEMFKAQNMERHYEIASGILMAVALIVAIFYCLDALYSERHDRSVLFWKSLPVSDTTVVMSKMAVPLVVLPIVTFVISIAMHLVLVTASAVVLSVNGRSTAALWHLPWLQMTLGVLHHIVTVHSLYYAPIFAWLLLVSAWAKRVPFLWAFLPPAAIAATEKLIFNTSHFATILSDRMTGGMEDTGGTMMPWPSNPLEFLGSPGLWIGFAFAAVCLGVAIRLRRYRDPI